jgi:hypothetical protein
MARRGPVREEAMDFAAWEERVTSDDPTETPSAAEMAATEASTARSTPRDGDSMVSML